MGEQGKYGKTFGYHISRAYGHDVAISEFLYNVNVEIEYDYSGNVIGLFVRRPKEEDTDGTR